VIRQSDERLGIIRPLSHRAFERRQRINRLYVYRRYVRVSHASEMRDSVVRLTSMRESLSMSNAIEGRLLN
jgi:hypothetical protein